MRCLFVAGLLFSALPYLCRAQQLPTIDGYVTTPGTDTFQVHGIQVLCDSLRTENLVSRSKDKIASTLTKQCPLRRLGEYVTVFGKRNKKSQTVVADQVKADPPTDLAVDGYAIIDRILASTSNGTALFRADGYRIHLTPETKVTFAQDSGLTLNGLSTNLWVRYTGTLRDDGTVAAASLLFSPNLVKSSEDTLRHKSDFDAAAVRQEDRQGTASRLLLGRNAKRIPAAADAQAQQHLTAVGQNSFPYFSSSSLQTIPPASTSAFNSSTTPNFTPRSHRPAASFRCPRPSSNRCKMTAS